MWLKHLQKETQPSAADRVEIVYYTDPLCCWSWALEPHFRRLCESFGDQIHWRYCMGGLIADWNSYSDPMNSVSRPIQMGPVWMEARHISGVPIHERIWLDDPPASSYPACIAVKCALLQSASAGEAYLRSLREAVMVKGRNIAKREILIEVAGELAATPPKVLDLDQFVHDLETNAGVAAFREDLHKVHYHRIGRFPTLTLSKPKGPGVIIVGYRPYQALLTALKQVAPDIQPVQNDSNADA